MVKYQSTYFAVCILAVLLFSTSCSRANPPVIGNTKGTLKCAWETATCLAIYAQDPLPFEDLKNAKNYEITLDGKPCTVSCIGWQQRLCDLIPGSWPHKPVNEYCVYLSLPKSAASCKEARIYWKPGLWAETIDGPARAPVRCIHLNSVGYDSDDATKYAYLGSWRGTGGALKVKNDACPYRIQNAEDGSVVFTGVFEVIKKDDPESGENVYRCDFSTLKTPGTYYIHVPDIGRSIPFNIAKDVYAPVRKVLLRALYHQRCGIAIGPPYTACSHDVCHTSLALHVSVVGSMDDMMKKLSDTVILPEKEYDGHGGWHDAGDYDRAGWHIFVVTRLLDAFTLAPHMYSDDTNIPESGNTIPDILDEAMWGLDWFARMQDETDGGLWYRIETEKYGHCMPEEDDQQLYVMAKYPKYTCYYAAYAAYAARVLKPYIREEKYKELLKRSRMAYTFAKNNKAPDEALSEAAAHLFLTTEEALYHNDFLALPKRESLSYALSTNSLINVTAQDACRQTICKAADDIIKEMQTHAYPCYQNVGNSAGMGAAKCMRAYCISGKKAYRDAARTLIHAQLGANALRRSWITGVGINPPEEVTHAPSLYGGYVVPGLPIFGPQKYTSPPGATHARVMYESATPAPYPWMRMYAPVWEIPGISEFTIRDIANIHYAYCAVAASSDAAATALFSYNTGAAGVNENYNNITHEGRTR